MPRLLIADTAEAQALALQKRLGSEYEIRVCHDGNRAVELIHSFLPDIIVLDLMLPHIDGMSILFNLRASGRRTKVITLSRFYSDYIMTRLSKLDVIPMTKPYGMGAMLTNICDLAKEDSREEKNVESELEYILLQLSFRTEVTRCNCVRRAILEKYHSAPNFVTKELYPAVAKTCGGSVERVEKAIRDMIKDARENGNRALWRLYFPSGKCPSNDVFIGKMATYLHSLCDDEKELDKAQ